jgi:hypothetical protein
MFLLKNVCWFDPFINAIGVPTGIKYRLYILHGSDKSGLSNMLKCADLFVELWPTTNPEGGDPTSTLIT